MDALVGITVTLLGLGIYAALFRRTGDALHPLAVFAGFWLVVFGFAHFDVARTYDEPYYAEPFGFVTYLVVFGALATFGLGFWLVDPTPEPLDRPRVARRFDTGVRWSQLAWWTVALFTVATLTTAYFVRQAGEIPLFSPRIDELRTTFKLPLIGYLYDLHYPVALFSAMLALRASSPMRRASWAALAVASIFQLMFAGVRVSPMTAMAWVIVFVFYRTSRVRARHMIVAATVSVAAFTVIEGYRRTMYTYNPALVNPRLDLSVPATAWAHTAASFKNLQLTLTRGSSPLNLGLNSYDLPKTLAPGARSVDERISRLYGTHNTPTFLSFLYYDYGLGGLLVMPLVYGAMVAFVYRRFRAHANLFWLLVHIDFLLAAALAFRTHRFLGNNLIWFGGVALLSQWIAGRPPVGDAPEEGAEAALRESREAAA